MNLVNIISSRILDSKILLKFRRMGKNDVQETPIVAPYGVDSNPIAGMVALYAETGEKGKNVLVGYLNKNARAGVGELRFYATNNEGTEQNYIWFRSDGNLEINGDDDNMVRYSELKAGFDQLLSDHNQLVQNVNAFFQNYLPGSPTPARAFLFK